LVIALRDMLSIVITMRGWTARASVGAVGIAAVPSETKIALDFSGTIDSKA
jgi:hypothetical protein